jgi:hypothetical protein
MTRNVTLHLEEFDQRALDRLVREENASPDATLRTAVLYYLADRDAQRPGWRAPRRFRLPPDPSSDLEVVFDDVTWAALELEAKRQGVTSDALAVHTVLYYVADFESGRLAERLGETLSEDE